MNEVVDPQVYKFFANYVFEKTGIFYPEKDYYRLDSRLLKLQKHYKCESIAKLYEKYKNHLTIDMEMFLIDICTNNETYFFRDQKPFDALVKEIIPNILKDRASLNIWSCASSTGQEALSIVMSIKEAGITKPFSIDASDISDQALTKAKSGVYTGLDVQRGLPIQLLVKYFDAVEGGSWRAKSEIHSPITYSKFNLFNGLYKRDYYDVIFCRNVLIYQNQENKQMILEKLTSSLRPNGIILMGAGESLIGIKSELKQTSLENGIVFQKNLESKSVA